MANLLYLIESSPSSELKSFSFLKKGSTISLSRPSPFPPLSLTPRPISATNEHSPLHTHEAHSIPQQAKASTTTQHLPSHSSSPDSHTMDPTPQTTSPKQQNLIATNTYAAAAAVAVAGSAKAKANKAEEKQEADSPAQKETHQTNLYPTQTN